MDGPSWLEKEKSTKIKLNYFILKGDIEEFHCLVNSDALKHYSMAFILMVKNKVFIHRLLITNLYY